MYEEIKDENDPKEDYEFSEQAKLFLASFQAMKEKYQHLLLKQSQVSILNNRLMSLNSQTIFFSSNFLAKCTHFGINDARSTASGRS